RGRLHPARVRIAERLGKADDPRVFSLLAIHGAGIPTEFPAEAADQAARARFEVPKGYTDLTGLPLVTIDGADARDFDDAVWAEPDGEGWHLVVAIADVAHYVPAGSPLDREAEKRGNSVYLPDRVVPMLPEALSNGLCSLVPGEERLCLAADLWIDGDGNLSRHRFRRGVMRSHARLTYEQVQAARDGSPDETTAALLDTAIALLYGAFAALSKAREARGTLDLDLPERVVRIGEDGHVVGIAERTRLDSHRLIEEFMIAANVAAAESLAGSRLGCIYRVHDAPDPTRLDALRDALSPLGYRLAKGQVIRPRAFTQVLDRVRGTAQAPLVNELILRSQAQAAYSPDNIGHFGLALPLYAHFTSPIRRYADLTVHRALIRRFSLGSDGTTEEEQERLEEVAEHISVTERRAAAAEREAVDRFTAAFLMGRIGEVFSGRIMGVTRFGLFVRLAETGADGLVPVSTLPDDFYHHDEAAHCLVGRRWGRVFGLGAPVTVRLVQAEPLTGGCLLNLVDADEGAPGELAPRAMVPGAHAARPRGRPPQRGKRRR
ncbi:MAG: ribonuclease R, partial [Rhodospirillaceae bacterium]|nr:ribonuclease R [Rhodospirillaceae bacterium]